MAGLVWIAAGANILKIGIYTWMNDALQWQLKLAGAVVIFCLFFFLIFKRLHGKHTRRIAEMGDQNHPLAFFDAKGWLVMLFMIGMGISIRTFIAYLVHCFLLHGTVNRTRGNGVSVSAPLVEML